MTSPSPPKSPAHIVLLGLMGAGKTTVGRALAARLGRPLDDSDLSIESSQGATVRELSERLGVAAMHRLEAEHLLAALGNPEPSIVCAAASVVEHQACVEALRRADVFPVWLELDVATLAARFSSGPHRPVLDADAATLFHRQLAERSRRFAAVARARVPVAGRTPEAIAAEIAAAIAGSGGGGGADSDADPGADSDADPGADSDADSGAE
ncbi:MAG TPA: shikimate kinase [Solirubrobacteraceae bacterium]|nr:shikimate kinase [Solirubrobacteraceae bacterium]